MDIVFVVDIRNSALYTAAVSRARLVNGIVVIASDFRSPFLLLQYLIRIGPKTILFSWRRALADVVCTPKGRNLYLKLHSVSSIGLLVPDHVGLNPENRRIEQHTINLSDFYLVTSKILFDEYSKVPTFPKPFGILHDLPDISAINEIRESYEKELHPDIVVILVGNSKWEKRSGFTDHKGFHEIVQPLSEQLKVCHKEIELKVIDSSEKRLSNFEVLKEIYHADVLIQTSKSEGTGLPLLEAIGLGTSVITTNVGVASEVLGGDSENIVNYNVEDFYKKIVLSARSREVILRRQFMDFINSATSEKIPFDQKKSIVVSQKAQFLTAIVVNLKWLYRNLRSTSR